MKEDIVVTKKRVAVVTNDINCERHIQYFATLEKYFLINGWTISEDFQVEKVIIIACGFHDVMHEKVSKTLKMLKDMHFLEKNIAVMGCQSKTHEDELRRIFKGQLIPFHKEEELDRLIDARVPFKEITPVNLFKPHKSCRHIKKDTGRFYIKIAEGCMTECTFCVINKAKGYIKSRPVEEIEREYQAAAAQGYRGIHLMGEDTFAYGIDTGTTIIELINHLLAIEDNVELFFGSLHCRWFLAYSEDIFSLCKRGIIKELHFGLQHVNEKLLRRMGRAVDFTRLYETLRALKKECPDLFMEVDMIVGFPGETEEMFQELVEFIKTDKCFNRVLHLGFSDVKGAPSFNFKDKVPSHEIIRRWEIMGEALNDPATYSQTNETRLSDFSYKLTEMNNYFFCKDTFKDDLDKTPIEGGVTRASSNRLKEDNDEFGF